MSEKRQIEQHAREIHFAGLEPVQPHVGGTDISSVVTLSPAPSGSNMLLMQAQGNDLFYTLDGTDPIPTGGAVGFLVKADDPVTAIPAGIATVVKVVELPGTGTTRFQYQWSL